MQGRRSSSVRIGGHRWMKGTWPWPAKGSNDDEGRVAAALDLSLGRPDHGSQERLDRETVERIRMRIVVVIGSSGGRPHSSPAGVAPTAAALPAQSARGQQVAGG